LYEEFSETVWQVHTAAHNIKYLLLSSDFNETEFSRQIFDKNSNIKFHENSFSDKTYVPYGQTDGRPNITKLIIAFLYFAYATKNRSVLFL
jgi:hypothetical protein